MIKLKSIYSTVKSSVYKLRLISCLIKGLSIYDAIIQLRFSKKRSSNYFFHILKSALFSFILFFKTTYDHLYIHECNINKSFYLKRSSVRAKGRVNKINKPFSTITVVIAKKKNIVWDKKLIQIFLD